MIDCANVDDAGTRAESFADDQPERFRVLHMEPTLASLGWSSVVSAAINLSRCEVFVIMDLSTIIEEMRSAPCWTSSVVMASWAQDGRA